MVEICPICNKNKGKIRRGDQKLCFDCNKGAIQSGTELVVAEKKQILSNGNSIKNNLCQICNLKKGKIARDGQKICLDCNKKKISNSVPVKQEKSASQSTSVSKISEAVSDIPDSVQETMNPDEKIIKIFERLQCNTIAGNAPKNAWGQEVETKLKFGFLVITNSRIFHISKSMFSQALLEIPISQASGVNIQKKIMFADVTINSNFNTKIEIQGCLKETADEISKSVNSAITQTQSSNSSEIKSESIPEKIRQLSELKNQGILTEEEFNQKKTELLKQM